ncbi:MAG: UbiA family prenyltransferase [Flavobacteriales bacterium]
MSTEIKNPVVRFLVYGHVWLALGAAAQVWWLGKVFFVEDKRLAGFAGCATIAAYGAMRLWRLDKASATGNEPMAWFHVNRQWVALMVTACAVSATVLVWPLLGKVLPALVLPGAIALLYVLPLRLTGGRILGLRRIPYMKSLWTAGVWAAISVLLPMAVDPDPPSTGLITLLFLMQCCFVYALMIAFDIRDRSYDMASLRTLPQLLGDRWARRASVVLICLPALFLLWYGAASAHSDVWPIVLPVPAYLLGAVLLARATPQRPDTFYVLWLDGLLILVPVLAWVGTLL